MHGACLNCIVVVIYKLLFNCLQIYSNKVFLFSLIFFMLMGNLFSFSLSALSFSHPHLYFHSFSHKHKMKHLIR